MKVKWLLRALDDLDSVFDYIADENPAAARDVVQRIWTAAMTLAEHPGVGRPGRVEGTRELVVTGTPYSVIYRVRQAVEILRVLHGAMRWPASNGDQ